MPVLAIFVFATQIELIYKRASEAPSHAPTPRPTYLPSTVPSQSPSNAPTRLDGAVQHVDIQQIMNRDARFPPNKETLAHLTATIARFRDIGGQEESIQKIFQSYQWAEETELAHHARLGCYEATFKDLKTYLKSAFKKNPAGAATRGHYAAYLDAWASASTTGDMACWAAESMGGRREAQ